MALRRAHAILQELTGSEGTRLVPIEVILSRRKRVGLAPRCSDSGRHTHRRRSYQSGTKGTTTNTPLRSAMDIATSGCSVNVKFEPKTRKRSSMLASVTARGGPDSEMRTRSANKAIKDCPFRRNPVEAFAAVRCKSQSLERSWRPDKRIPPSYSGARIWRVVLTESSHRTGQDAISGQDRKTIQDD